MPVLALDKSTRRSLILAQRKRSIVLLFVRFHTAGLGALLAFFVVPRGLAGDEPAGIATYLVQMMVIYYFGLFLLQLFYLSSSV